MAAKRMWKKYKKLTRASEQNQIIKFWEQCLKCPTFPTCFAEVEHYHHQPPGRQSRYVVKYLLIMQKTNDIENNQNNYNRYV